MNRDFIITGIRRVILVGEQKDTEKISSFSNDLPSNELIFNLSGQKTVHFNGKVLEDEPNSVRFLPKGKNTEYTVDRHQPGACFDICFYTDLPAV